MSGLDAKESFHLRPHLVRLLFKHGAQLCMEEDGKVISGGSAGVDVLKLVLKVTNEFVPSTAEEASALTDKVKVRHYNRRCSLSTLYLSPCPFPAHYT